jgi:hypothetical protein
MSMKICKCKWSVKCCPLFTKMGLKNASQNDSPNNEEGLVEQTLTKWQAKAMLVLGWIAKQQQ